MSPELHLIVLWESGVVLLDRRSWCSYCGRMKCIIVLLAVITFELSDAIWIHRPFVHHPHQRPIKRPTTATTTTTTAAAPPAFEPGFNCENEPDGVYDLGCSKDFVFCVNGKAIYQECPNGYVYDSVYARCLHRRYVAACGGIPTELPTTPSTTEAPQATEPTTVFSPPETATLPETTTTEEPVYPCEGRATGVYGHGCSPDYTYCSSGHPSYFRCPAPTMYNPVTHHCAPVGTIPSCHGGHHLAYPQINIGQAY